jgi:myo-inositol-1(or 4)-monophosphatase
MRSETSYDTSANAGSTAAARDLRAFAESVATDAVVTIAAGLPDPAHSSTKVDAGDWVTPFDRAVEEQVRLAIHERYPLHRVVGEEFGADEVTEQPAAVTWYLDPIDGTMNYVHRLPWVAFSLAAVDSEGVAAGVVADVYRATVYSAFRGGGAQVGQAPAVRADHGTIAGGLFLTEWSRQEAWLGMETYLKRISSKAGATRIMGSCALALALVGTGQATGAVLPGHYNPWDVLAGALIAREGGAMIYGLSGPTQDVPMDGIMAAVPGVADELWRAWVGKD